MEYCKTVKIPIHYGVNKEKIAKLDKLTARWTYAVRLWSGLIKKHNIQHKRQLSLEFHHFVRDKTKLSAGFVQQARDKAWWMWQQYRKTHKNWQSKVSKAKGKRLEKLKKRKPSEPCTSTKSLLKKIPVRIDYRTGEVKTADLRLTDHVINLSTLKKHGRMTILLNPSTYHKNLLKKGKVSDFEIVKKGKKYYAHVNCKFDIPARPIQGVRGIDLGIRRTLSDVLIRPMPVSFSNTTDKEKNLRLKKLNNRISHLQRLQKWKALKKLRHKRLNYSIYRDLKTAKQFAQKCGNELVIIGHPKNIRYDKYKGNGDKKGRKLLQGWAFLRLAQMIKAKLNEIGVAAEIANEWRTSKKCHKCNSIVKRIDWSRIACNDCGMQYDADYNAAINTARKGMPLLGSKSSLEEAGASDDHARSADDSAQKLMSAQPFPKSLIGSPAL